MSKNSAFSPGWRTVTIKGADHVGPAWWWAAGAATFAFTLAITWLLT
jgi:hypothetical protein